MRSIRIHIKADVTDEKAMELVSAVMSEGKISQSKYGPTYCRLTVFKSGYFVRAEQGDKGVSFHIMKDQGHD